MSQEPGVVVPPVGDAFQTTAMVPHAVPSAAELEAELALARGPTRAVQHTVTALLGTAALGFGGFTVVTLWYFVEAGAKSTFLVVLGGAYVAVLGGVTTLLAHAAQKNARRRPDVLESGPRKPRHRSASGL